MKKAIVYSVLGLFLLSCNQTKESVQNSEQENGKWQLIWEDNFDQTGSFDDTVWTKIPRGGSDWNNYMSDYDSLYAVKDGNLILRGIVNELPGDSVPFITGGLYTKGKKTFMDGRLEIRAKLWGTKGAWPAIWMLPENAAWPMGGEIDVMERLNNNNKVYQTIHTNYTYNLGIKNPIAGGTNLIDRDDFNVYTVELYPDSLSFYVNDKHTFTYPRIETDKEGQFPFHQPFYLLIDMQLGGTWVGDVDPDDLPLEMWIDWVKFYKQREE